MSVLIYNGFRHSYFHCDARHMPEFDIIQNYFATQLLHLTGIHFLHFSDDMVHSVPQESAIQLALNAGDNDELCFTVPAKQCEADLARLPCRFTCIGEITKQTGL